MLDKVGLKLYYLLMMLFCDVLKVIPSLSTFTLGVG